MLDRSWIALPLRARAAHIGRRPSAAAATAEEPVRPRFADRPFNRRPTGS
ncbi:hypothetical protein [Streptomyces malaysiensis]